MTKNRVVNWAMNNGALVGLIALCIALFIATPYFLTCLLYTSDAADE